MAVNCEKARILTKPDVLEEDHLPDHMLYSEKRIAEIEDYLSPILRKQRPLHLWLYGDPGTGKTSSLGIGISIGSGVKVLVLRSGYGYLTQTPTLSH